MEPESKTITLQVLGNDTFIVKPDPAELCRLCANTDNQLIPIFKGEGLEHNIPSKLEKHLPIVKITETDKLPLQVCYQCASTLIAWHNLYEGCSVADKRLREILAVDEKLYHDEETFEDYGDDFRDDDFDQPHADFVQLNTASTSSQSGLGPNTSISEITQLGSSNTFDETENNNLADERIVSPECAPASVEPRRDTHQVPARQIPSQSQIKRQKKCPNVQNKRTSENLFQLNVEQNQNDCSLVSAQSTDTIPTLRNLKQNSCNYSKVLNQRTCENTSKLESVLQNQSVSPSVLTKRTDNTSKLNTSDCNENDNPAAQPIVVSEMFGCIICSSLFSCRQKLKQHLNAEHSLKPIFQDSSQLIDVEMASFEIEPSNVGSENPERTMVMDRTSGKTLVASEHPDIANEELERITLVSQNKSLNVVNEKSESAASIQVYKNTVKGEFQMPSAFLNECFSAVNGSPKEIVFEVQNEPTNVSSKGSPEEFVIVDETEETNGPPEETGSCPSSQLEDECKMYLCIICQAMFKRKKYIKQHLQKCHSLLYNMEEVKARQETLCSKNKGKSLEPSPANNAHPAEENVKAHSDTLCSKNKRKSLEPDLVDSAKPVAKVGAPYSCLLCQIPFTNLKYIRKHVLHAHVTKTGEGDSIKYRSRGLCCDVCGLFVEDMERLWAHRKVVHVAVTAPFKFAETENRVRIRLCYLCVKYFNQALFKEHECVVTPDVALNAAIDDCLRTAPTCMCDICGVCFHWKWSWRHHRLSAHKNMPDIDWNTVQPVVPKFCCKICLKGFVEESVFTLHDCQHKDKPPPDVKKYSCDICQRRFRRHYEVWNHKKARHMGIPAPKRIVKPSSESGRPKTKCPMCDLVFITSKMALAHIHSVHNLTLDTPFLCTDCKKTFNSMRTLRDHRELYHGLQKTEEEAQQICEQAKLIEDDVVMYQCNFKSCKRIFYNTLDYLKHYNWHRAERTFKCHVCGRKFVTAKRLYRHKKLCYDVDTFECDVCGLVYHARQKFVEHFAKNHANQDQRNKSKSICDKCGGFFVDQCRTCLKRELPKAKFRYLYTCDICSGRWRTKSGLEDHMHSHTGEKPYSCSICDRKFRRRKTLQMHEKSRHSGALWPCVFCPSMLSTEKSLKVHVRRHMKNPRMEVQSRKLSKKRQKQLGLLEK